MKVKELIDSILKNELSFFEIVQYIEINTTDSSKDLLLNEIYSTFKMKSLDFMFEVKDEDISDAINQFKHNLEYFYLSEEDKLKVQLFIKEIDNKLTIFNVDGLSKIEDTNKTKVIYLNNLMIDFYDGLFQQEIKGFENLNRFKSICESLKEHFEKPKDKIEPQPIQMNYTNYQSDDFKDLLLVEELEKRLAIEAVEYKIKIDELWQTYTFDPTYFDTFISGDLYNVFLNAIYERIKPLNDFEINKYLTLSVNQFKTHTPTKRAETFKRIYHATYWYPNQMEYKENEHDDKYAIHVWKHYTNHFHLYKEVSENVLQVFKKGLIGNGRKQDLSSTEKKLNHKQVAKNITKDILEKINSINSFELILFPESEKSSVILSSEEIQSQYANYTDKINTYIKEIYLDGNIEYLKRLLLTVNEYVTKWKKISSNDVYYLDIATSNEQYRHIAEIIDVAYIIKTKLLFLNGIKDNLQKLTDIRVNLVELNSVVTTEVSNENQRSFSKVITSENKREYIYNILEHFGAINSARKSVLTQRKKGVLRGVVEALMDNNILPELGLHNLCLMIAKDINLELKSKLDYHDAAKKTHKEAKKYIKDNPLR